jgi:uncharacterized protein (TIGR01777 family)
LRPRAVLMQVVVTGGTGFIGHALCERLAGSGHSVTVLTRSATPSSSGSSIRFVSFQDPNWLASLQAADAVVNLAGEPIAASRWTGAQKQRIRDSRIGTTSKLVAGLKQSAHRPAVLISASATGWYGPRGDEIVSEQDQPGAGFLADTCKAWEAEAAQAESLGIRVVLVRIGIVLAAGGGALAKMIPPFKAYLGGPLGSGRQWMSWIQRDDLVGLIEWSLSQPHLRGPVNATAPEPVTMREFCSQLGQALGRPSWAPVPAFALRLLLGEMAEMLLTGQRVVPRKLMDGGFPFRFPQIDAALRASVHGAAA